MRKILITEKQKNHLKKAIAAQDQVGGKVRVLSPGMVCEDEGETITLYHGVMAKNLEFNINSGGFVPRVCSEGGPKAIWMSEKMYGYQFTFKFDIPVKQVSQMTTVDYIYEGMIPFDAFNCELVKTAILVHYEGFVVTVNLLNRPLLENQLKIFPDLPKLIYEMFAEYPEVYREFIMPYLYNKKGLLRESPDTVEDYIELTWKSPDSVAFASYDDPEGVVFVADRYKTTHVELRADLYERGEIGNCYGRMPNENWSASGRYWEQSNIISFWKNYYHSSGSDTETTVSDMRNAVYAIANAGYRIDPRTLVVELWGPGFPKYVPYRWFTNGMWQMFNQLSFENRIRQIYPQDDNHDCFVVELNNDKRYYADISGNLMTPEEFQGRSYGMVMESNGADDGFETWYRGYNATYGSERDNLLWLTVDASYARAYGNRVEVMKLNPAKVNPASIEEMENVGNEIDEWFDYYDGPSDILAREMLSRGYNSYCFYANDEGSYCMCLWDKSAIVPNSRRELSQQEFEAIECYDNFENPKYSDEIMENLDDQEYQIGFEPGGFEPNAHLISEMSETFGNESFKYSESITFLSFADNPKVFSTNEIGVTHKNLARRLMSTGEIETFELDSNRFAGVWNPYKTGRYWVKSNTISFWETPVKEGTRQYLRDVVDQLGLDMNTLDIDFWDSRREIGVKSPFVFPCKWFFDGTFDDLMKMGAYSITKSESGSYHVIYGDFHHITFGRNGKLNNGLLRENRKWCEKFDYKPYLKSIANFLQDNGIEVKPLPKVILHHKDQEGLYIKTGYYDPMGKEVHLFVCDRHPKDVLRSFTHEMIHHNQNLRSILGGYKGDTLDGDDVLNRLESEAYLKGNIYFRRWTEELHPQIPGKKQKLNESFQDVLYMAEDEDIDFGVGSVVSEFFYDRSKGIARKQWRTIPAQQYKNLLERYMTDPMMARIPENVVMDWFMNIIVRNTFAIDAITSLAGHNQGYDYDEVQNELDSWMPGKYSEKIVDFDTAYDALDDEGFFEWCSLPDGTPAWSDYGLAPIYKELDYYKPGMPAGDLLILINRILHIGHCCGDLASAFIEGGSRSCSDISGIMRESIEETKWNGNREEWKGLEPVQNPPSALKFYGQNIEENFDISELSSPDSIDLSSFDIKDQLNPRFWKDGRLDSRVRIALLDIADDFIDSLDVNWVEPKDVIITGSLANFNWSKKHSDVDLHIVMNFSEVDTNVKLVKDYFDSKRRLWNDTHENLNIAGYPVELYVQDEHEPHASSGVYSLEKDEWLVEPSHDDMEVEYDEDVVRKKVSDYMNEIDELEEEYEDNVADCDLSELHDKVIDVFRRIKAERRNGFDNGGGEYNTGNIIFKALRRNGYIAKVDKLKTDTYDSMMSLLNENSFGNQK